MADAWWSDKKDWDICPECNSKDCEKYKKWCADADEIVRISDAGDLNNDNKKSTEYEDGEE